MQHILNLTEHVESIHVLNLVQVLFDLTYTEENPRNTENPENKRNPEDKGKDRDKRGCLEAC
jgi:hypothetical protein